MSSAIEKLAEIAERAGIRVSRRGALTLLAVLAVAGSISIWGMASNAASQQGGGFEVHEEDGEHEPDAPDPQRVGSDVGSSDATSPVAAKIFAHVVGAVRTPGVYELPAGARVQEAVLAAGGCLGNAAPQGLNLARALVDGEQLVVPTQDEWDASGSAAPGGSALGSGASAGRADGGGSPGGLVDLNSADATTLETLPGVGPATAAKIVSEREANGPFASIEDLARVAGIGSKKIEAIRDLATAK